jgi:hypothetical protein
MIFMWTDLPCGIWVTIALSLDPRDVASLCEAAGFRCTTHGRRLRWMWTAVAARDVPSVGGAPVNDCSGYLRAHPQIVHSAHVDAEMRDNRWARQRAGDSRVRAIVRDMLEVKQLRQLCRLTGRDAESRDARVAINVRITDLLDRTERVRSALGG